jgi:hypothetical protein
MSDSLVSFIALFRGVLMLLDVEPPADRHGTLAMTVEHLGLRGQPLEKIFNIRDGNFAEQMTDVEANQLFAEYMEQIESVIESVDTLGTVPA